jgi:hypothetical protein
MQFTIHCDCGRGITVDEWQAGSSLTCPACGRETNVPPSTKLRESAGLPAIELSPEIVISHMIRSGELPAPQCLSCGNDGLIGVEFAAECERQYVKRRSGVARLLAAALLPLIFAILFFERERIVSYGRDLVVPLPARFCESCLHHLPTLSRGRSLKLVAGLFIVLGIGLCIVQEWPVAATATAAGVLCYGIGKYQSSRTQQRLRELISLTAEYRTLLEKYPNARISAPRKDRVV